MAKNSSSPSFWRSLNPGQRTTLVATLALIIIVFPISVWASLNQVSYTPKAYQTDDLAVHGICGTNNPPTLQNGVLDGTITCTSNQNCTHKLSGSDKDTGDTLTMEADFLPPGLSIQNCLTSRNFLNAKNIDCQLTGTPLESGKYKIMVTLSDSSGNTTAKAYTLNVK